MVSKPELFSLSQPSKCVEHKSTRNPKRRTIWQFGPACRFLGPYFLTRQALLPSKFSQKSTSLSRPTQSPNLHEPLNGSQKDALYRRQSSERNDNCQKPMTSVALVCSIGILCAGS